MQNVAPAGSISQGPALETHISRFRVISTKVAVMDGRPHLVHVLAPRSMRRSERMTIRHRGEAWQRWQRQKRGYR
jgi:hypothetical protein